jgi:hypothetical protein
VTIAAAAAAASDDLARAWMAESFAGIYLVHLSSEGCPRLARVRDTSKTARGDPRRLLGNLAVLVGYGRLDVTVNVLCRTPSAFLKHDLSDILPRPEEFREPGDAGHR